MDYISAIFFSFFMKNFDLVKRILKFSLLYIFRYKFAREYLLITRNSNLNFSLITNKDFHCSNTLTNIPRPTFPIHEIISDLSNVKRIKLQSVLTITVIRLISLVLRFVMMSTGNRYLLHGDQIVVISVDQRILELGLDHLEAGRVVRMRDDLHCKRANVTEHGEENVGAAGTSSILIPALRHPQKINSREEIVEGTR